MHGMLNHEGSNHGLFALVQPCVNHGGIVVEPGITIVQPRYNMVQPWWGRFCHGTPILVNLVKSLEVDEWLRKSGSRINNCSFSYRPYND